MAAAITLTGLDCDSAQLGAIADAGQYPATTGDAGNLYGYESADATVMQLARKAGKVTAVWLLPATPAPAPIRSDAGPSRNNGVTFYR